MTTINNIQENDKLLKLVEGQKGLQLFLSNIGDSKPMRVMAFILLMPMIWRVKFQFSRQLAESKEFFEAYKQRLFSLDPTKEQEYDLLKAQYDKLKKYTPEQIAELEEMHQKEVHLKSVIEELLVLYRDRNQVILQLEQMLYPIPKGVTEQQLQEHANNLSDWADDWNNEADDIYDKYYRTGKLGSK